MWLLGVRLIAIASRPLMPDACVYVDVTKDIGTIVPFFDFVKLNCKV
jgi:hypothetical protein